MASPRTAQALARLADLTPKLIVETSLQIAADICIYTNRNLAFEEL